jgi:hypothetical protein
MNLKMVPPGFQLQGLVFLSKGGLVEDETWPAYHLTTF